MNCRHCDNKLEFTFVDLDSSPPSNSYVSKNVGSVEETWYPLKVLVCEVCWLAQTEDFVGFNEMFSKDYSYFSSFSSTWLKHAKFFVDMAVKRFKLKNDSMVVEIAANDGYLLQFVKEKNIPCYGVEPTNSTAEAARKKGIKIIEEFFSEQKAKNLSDLSLQADLIIANNVLAHVPDINDFVRGISVLLKPNGVATFEFPHLLNLVELNQFDTIYHEHYSYLSFTSVQRIFEANDLSVFDVEELSTHGGSLRIYAQRQDLGIQLKSQKVELLQDKEDKFGMSNLSYYEGFQSKIEKVKDDFVQFLVNAKNDGKQVVGYGAAAKGNTMLNFAEVDKDLISYIADKNPAKQGKYTPGSQVLIVGIENIKLSKPDFVVIFPWNLKDEIIEQLKFIKEWNGKFITAIPKLEIF